MVWSRKGRAREPQLVSYSQELREAPEGLGLEKVYVFSVAMVMYLTKKKNSKTNLELQEKYN